MSETVYIVTSGEYSDYHVVACFLDETLARRFAERYDDNWNGNARVEKYPLLAEVPQRADTLHIGGLLFQDGTLEPAQRKGFERTHVRFTLIAPFEPTTTSVTVHPPDDLCVERGWDQQDGRPHPYIYLVASGTDHVRTRKSWSELVARCRAEFDVLVAAEQEAAS